MADGKVLKMEPVSLQEVKEILKDRKGEKELTYEQEITYKYVEKFSKLTEKQSKDILTGLKEIEFLKENKELQHQILAAVPTKIEQVKIFLPKDVNATDEELKQIVELTKKHGEKL